MQSLGNVSESGSGLTLASSTFGPRYSWRTGNRWTPFAQILLGGAYGSLPQGNSPAFALKLGGGLDLRVNSQWAVRLFDADYYYTHFPNGVNSSLNNVQLGAGIVFRIGHR